MARVETFDTLQWCVVCGEKIKKGVAVIKKHTTGEFATQEEVNKLRGTPACEDYSLYYAGVYCFQTNNLKPFVTDPGTFA